MDLSEKCRYFIAILLPSPIHEEALTLKNYFREKYHSKASLNSPPHITLHMPFLWKEKREDDLINILHKFGRSEEKIQIDLHGFGAFPPRVIFIKVKENHALNEQQARLQKFCKQELNLFNAQYKDQPFHPHITLAFRDLKKENFSFAWGEFQSKELSASFIADQFTLLKHDGKAWQSLHHFHF